MKNFMLRGDFQWIPLFPTFFYDRMAAKWSLNLFSYLSFIHFMHKFWKVSSGGKNVCAYIEKLVCNRTLFCPIAFVKIHIWDFYWQMFNVWVLALWWRRIQLWIFLSLFFGRKRTSFSLLKLTICMQMI
jgi:hypothetical protein